MQWLLHWHVSRGILVRLQKGVNFIILIMLQYSQLVVLVLKHLCFSHVAGAFFFLITWPAESHILDISIYQCDPTHSNCTQPIMKTTLNKHYPQHNNNHPLSHR